MGNLRDKYTDDEWEELLDRIPDPPTDKSPEAIRARDIVNEFRGKHAAELHVRKLIEELKRITPNNPENIHLLYWGKVLNKILSL